jgi:hypothetical protein
VNLRPRRRLAAATALAALVSLSACASQAEDPAPPTTASSTPTATPTPTPTLSPAEKTEAFCKAVVGLDTAMLHLGPPAESSATASPEPSSSSSMKHHMGSTDGSTDSTSTPTPMYTAAAESTATPDATADAGGPPPGPDLAEVMTPAIDALAKAPRIDEVGSDVDSMLALLRKAVDTKDRNLLDSEEYFKAGAGVDRYMLSNCGYGKLAASAIDFEYDGLPTTLKSGPSSVSLTNDGKELHEIVLFRINDGVTQDFAAILELPEKEVDTKVVPMGVVVVPPGQTGTSFFDLPSGRYGIACFIPKGTKNGKEGTGPPHFKEGMVADLTVT